MTNKRLALMIVRYLIITAILFVGIDHFMSIEQGWAALILTGLWFVWSFGPSRGSSQPQQTPPDTGVVDEDSYWRTGDITGTDI